MSEQLWRLGPSPKTSPADSAGKIMELSEFRRRFRSKTLKLWGLTWRLIETKPKAANAPALLMLPGTLGSAEIFWRQIVALGDRLRVMSVTYPQIADIERLADGLAALLDRNGVSRASVVGSSLGGFLAQWFAARHPGRVDRLFIGSSLADPKLLDLTGRTPAALESLPATRHRDFILASVRSWPEPEPVFAALKAVLIESGTKLLSPRALKARVLAVQRSPAVPRLQIPDGRITVIDCADDPLIPRHVQDDVRRRYQGAKYVRLPVGGHYPYITRSEAYTAILSRALC